MTTRIPQPQRRGKPTLVGTDQRARLLGMLVVNTGLALLLGGLYVATLYVLSRLGVQAALVQMLATVAVAVTVIPVRRRLVDLGNRLTQREWQDSQDLVRDIGTALSRTIEPEALRAILVDDLPGRLGVQGATLWMLEPPDDRVFTALGCERAEQGATLLAHGVSVGQVRYAASCLQMPDLHEIEWAEPFVARGVHLIVPLRLGERLIGIYGCGRPNDRATYLPHVVGVLLTLAPSIAGSIENARAYTVIARLNAQLRALDQLKGEFIESMGHELRTPLTSLSLATQLIAGQPELAHELNGVMQDNVVRLQELIDRVLSLDPAREMAAESAGTASVELAPLLEDIVGAYAATARAKGLAFALDVPPGISVWGEAAVLRRSLNELVDNAVRYTTAGTIALAARMQDGLALISVTDQGPGIPIDEQPLLFATFYRGSKTRALSGTPGAGVGLSIAKREIEALGGRVWLERTSAEGTTMCVALRGVVIDVEDEAGVEMERVVGE